MPDTSHWHTGDIFFSVGDSWESVAVRSFTSAKNFELSDSTPSHCGLIIRDADKVLLVHASTTAGKVVAETPQEYQVNNGSYCLYCHRVPIPVDTVAIKHTLDSLIANNVPFDFEFDHRESKSLYCTEMVVTALECNGIYCFTPLREKSYMYPDDVLKICTKSN